MARRKTILVVAALVALGSVWSAAAEAKQGKDLSWVLGLSDRAKARLPARTKRAAVQKYGLKALALRRCFVRQHDKRYPVQVPGSGKASQVRNQQYSGRCWIFASGRVLRSKTAKHVKEPPKLSTSFVNYHALRQASRALLKEAFKSGSRASFDQVTDASEGGFQIWAMDIVRRHGFVPAEKMPFTHDGADPGVYLTHLQTLVASATRDFSRLDGKGATKAQRKVVLSKYQRQVDDLLSTTIGKPPRAFTYKGKRYTPRRFRTSYLKLKDSDLDYVTLTNYPNRGWYRAYRNGDAPGFSSFEELNLPMKVIQRAIKKTLRGGEAVLFGMNVADDHPYRASSKSHPDKAKGILSLDAFRYGNFIPAPKLSKRDAIASGISAADHAMVFTGYDPAKQRGKVRKWRVENSHGPKEGDRGHFHAYDDYVRRYLEDVVVPRSALPASLDKRVHQKPVLERPEARSQAARGQRTDLPSAIRSLRRLLK